MPDAAPNEAENVEQPKTIVTHRRLEVNPKGPPNNACPLSRRIGAADALAVRIGIEHERVLLSPPDDDNVRKVSGPVLVSITQMHVAEIVPMFVQEIG